MQIEMTPEELETVYVVIKTAWQRECERLSIRWHLDKYDRRWRYALADVKRIADALDWLEDVVAATQRVA